MPGSLRNFLDAVKKRNCLPWDQHGKQQRNREIVTPVSGASTAGTRWIGGLRAAMRPRGTGTGRRGQDEYTAELPRREMGHGAGDCGFEDYDPRRG